VDTTAAASGDIVWILLSSAKWAGVTDVIEL